MCVANEINKINNQIKMLYEECLEVENMYINYYSCDWKTKRLILKKRNKESNAIIVTGLFANSINEKNIEKNEIKLNKQLETLYKKYDLAIAELNYKKRLLENGNYLN